MKIKIVANILITFFQSEDDSSEELIEENTIMDVDYCGESSSFSKTVKFHEFQCGNGDFFSIPKESFVILEN